MIQLFPQDSPASIQASMKSHSSCDRFDFIKEMGMLAKRVQSAKEAAAPDGGLVSIP